MVRASENAKLSGASGEIDDIIERIVFKIRRLIQAEERHTKALNKKYAVSAPQLNSLMALLKNGPSTPSQIAGHILVESSTVTGIIDRLETKGLVRRIRSAEDRRKIYVELTHEGRSLASHAPPPIRTELDKGLRELDRDKLKTVLEGLTILTELLDKRTQN